METTLYYPREAFDLETSNYPNSNSIKQLHFHKSYELHFLEKGQHGYLINDKYIQAFEHDVILLKPDILHKTCNGKNYNRTSLYFTADFIKQFYTDKATRHLLKCFNKEIISLDTESFYKAQRLIQRINKMHNKNNTDELCIYLGDLLDLLVQNVSSPRRDPPLHSMEKISPILAYIAEHYKEITYLDEIASQFYISTSQLCRVFKENTGMTVTQYINQLKVQFACELLTTSDKNITEIAIECGFNSSVYFCKTFKKQTGSTPSEFRDKTIV